MHALRGDMVSIFQYFLKDGKLNLGDGIDEIGHGIICKIASANAVKVMDVFIEHFGRAVVHIPCRQYNQNTALIHAVVADQPGMVEWLISSADADIMSCNEEGVTIFHLLCQLGHLDICTRLQHYWVGHVNVRDKMLRTPLHAVCEGNKTETGASDIKMFHRADLVILLIEAGAHKNAQDHQGLTPVDYARRYGYFLIVEYLIEEERAAAVGMQ